MKNLKIAVAHDRTHIILYWDTEEDQHKQVKIAIQKYEEWKIGE